jgi:predicted lipoprotein with Yx(FWY)xxD motif
MRFMDGKVRAVAGGFAVALALAACGHKATATTGGSGGGNAVVVGTESLPSIGAALADSRGFTLYHLKTETNGQIQCTGSCAATWPPLLVNGSGAPTAGSGLSGTMGTVTRPDGTVQVTYGGMPLYTYSGDTGPHQANGQGIQGVWFAVTASGSSPASSSPAKGYGY